MPEAKMEVDNRTEYDRRICRAIDYIHSHFREEMTIDTIAKSAAFSKFHFQRLFRATTGESVAEFVRRLRLETAARRLRVPHSDLDITTLALDLGFSSSQNFAKAFKNFFGVSASDYRTMSSPGSFVAKSRELQKGSGFDSRPLNVSVLQIPEQLVAYKRHFGSYSDRRLERTFAEVSHWADANTIGNEVIFLGIPWDDIEITEDSRCQFDCCVVVPDASVIRSINTQSISAGAYAVMRKEIVQHDFESPWDELMQIWLPGSGLFPDDRPRFERYLTDGSNDPEGKWLVEFCLPVSTR